MVIGQCPTKNLLLLHLTLLKPGVTTFSQICFTYNQLNLQHLPMRNLRNQFHKRSVCLTVTQYVALILTMFIILSTHHTTFHPTPLCLGIQRFNHLWRHQSLPPPLLLPPPQALQPQLGPLHGLLISSVWLGGWLLSCLLLTQTLYRSKVGVCPNIRALCVGK